MLFLTLIAISNLLVISKSEENLQIVSRYEWGAKRAGNTGKAYPDLPAYVLIKESGNETCYFPEECKATLRMAQLHDMQYRKYNDILENFLVGGDGLIYAGRGWDLMPADPFNFNATAILISIIGTFEKHFPTNVQIRSAQRFLESAVKYRKIHRQYKLLGCSQLINNVQVGKKLFEIIRTWPHWSPLP